MSAIKRPINSVIMGILNITPDSFADGGKYLHHDNAIKKAKAMIRQGADIIDIGGESTRPNASEVSTKDEIDRIVPIIKTLNSITDTCISVDTSKPKVMELAVNAGASMINDIKALQNDGALEIAAHLNTDVCLVHMQGSPRTMQQNPKYKDVIYDIKKFFECRIKACIKAGIKQNKIILDPGFGFGKTLAHNIEILKRLSEFKSLGFPILTGLSNKSMIGALLNNRSVNKRVVGSVTATIIAILNGANIVRVHNILATKDALTILNSIKG